MVGSGGDYAWVMASSALVFMMLPGIAIFYGGLRSQTTVLSLLWLNMMAFSLVIVQWFLVGYTLVFSPTSGSHFIGNLHNAAFLNTMAVDSYAGIREGDTPAMVFGLFQGMFASFTIALVTGVIAERGRLLPFLVFTIVWTTLVYDPIAYWMWNSNGWGNRLGALDWAGGTPVHICSGAASLAYTLMLKHLRKTSLDTPSLNDSLENNPRSSPTHKPPPKGPRVTEATLASHNIPIAFLGLMLVWFGWFGFNAGSELKANMRAASTFVATNIAAASGGLTYCLCENWKGKWSGIGFCTGAFAGLVAITPGAGYVPMWAGLVFGITASLLCFTILYFTNINEWLEEPLDICVVHGAGGLCGMLLTGIFADKATAALDGKIIDGGAINGHGIQIAYQLAGSAAGFGYSFIVTLLILIVIHLLSKTPFFPGLKLRAESRDSTQQMRLDDEELGDRHAYVIYYPLSNPVEEEPEQEHAAATQAQAEAQTHIPDTAPALTPAPLPVPAHQNWQSGAMGEAVPMQTYKLPRIDPQQGSSSGYSGLERGGSAAAAAGGGAGNAGEGSSSHPFGPVQPFKDFQSAVYR